MNFLSLLFVLTITTVNINKAQSIAYEFGPNNGIIQYTFPIGRQPDIGKDNIEFGFITTKSDAVLLRIESNLTQDYLEFEIGEGNIFMVYNIESLLLRLGESGIKVNDNKYHIVRFIRSGGNATFQLDYYNVKKFHPQEQLSIFNTMTNIQVGGKFIRQGSIVRPFAGIIAGLSINKLRVLVAAAERDQDINISGDVQLVPASGYPGAMDDLIFSDAGIGCRGDDDDECTPPFESGSGDDLIIPIYVPPTILQKSSDKKDESGGIERTCDDEDCFHGSADYGKTTEQFTLNASKGIEPGIISKIHNATSSSGSRITPISSSRIPLLTTTNGEEGKGTTIKTFGTTISTTHTAQQEPQTTSFDRETTPYDTSNGSSISYHDRTSTTKFEPNAGTELPPSQLLPAGTNTGYSGKGRRPPRINSIEEERTAMIIGIVAGILIAVVLVILLVFFFSWFLSIMDIGHQHMQ